VIITNYFKEFFRISGKRVTYLLTNPIGPTIAAKGPVTPLPILCLIVTVEKRFQMSSIDAAIKLAVTYLHESHSDQTLAALNEVDRYVKFDF
jgi:hypothetical protein